MSARRRVGAASVAVLAALVALAPRAVAAAPVAAAPAAAQAASPGLSLLLSVAVVSLLPFLFLSLTSFVKISTVLQITKSAIGAQSVPSNTVILALSGALTLLAMAPTASAVFARAAPVLAENPQGPEAIVKVAAAAREPMRAFLRQNASEREVARFVAVAKTSAAAPATGPSATDPTPAVEESDLAVLAPAFVVTELTEAFAIGFLIFLPFLVIDLVVANVLASLGLQTLSVSQVSLPFKLLLFVSVDGWGLLAQALVLGYRH
ncbi:MAG: EscR/YscR/HrcR family type III secretion system export apparatus protein [Myxococcales bacterium]|nr:EscR/YscR/HrcR family type III secretion system export apparatus protein [Myxococcales bacterium]MBL0196305.1 EscR/YscR/HrcR family type III secretion system export apparatus protein [Myxococcales bacterium]